MTAETMPVVVVALAVSLLLERVKTLDMPGLRWINEHSSSINRAVSIVIAIVSAAGLHYSFHRLADGQASLTLMLPSWEMLKDALVQWIVQHSAYKAVIRPASQFEELKSMLDEVRKEQITHVDPRAVVVRPATPEIAGVVR